MNDRFTSMFKPGDRVTVHTSQGGPQNVLTVARITHEGRCVELGDGSRWRPDGKRQWDAHGSFYKGPWITATVEGDTDHVAKRRAVGRIRKFADRLSMESPLSAAALARILAVIDAEHAKLDMAEAGPDPDGPDQDGPDGGDGGDDQTNEGG